MAKAGGQPSCWRLKVDCARFGLPFPSLLAVSSSLASFPPGIRYLWASPVLHRTALTTLQAAADVGSMDRRCFNLGGDQRLLLKHWESGVRDLLWQGRESHFWALGIQGSTHNIIPASHFAAFENISQPYRDISVVFRLLNTWILRGA